MSNKLVIFLCFSGDWFMWSLGRVWFHVWLNFVFRVSQLGLCWEPKLIMLTPSMTGGVVLSSSLKQEQWMHFTEACVFPDSIKLHLSITFPMFGFLCLLLFFTAIREPTNVGFAGIYLPFLVWVLSIWGSAFFIIKASCKCKDGLCGDSVEHSHLWSGLAKLICPFYIQDCVQTLGHDGPHSVQAWKLLQLFNNKESRFSPSPPSVSWKAWVVLHLLPQSGQPDASRKSTTWNKGIALLLLLANNWHSE